MLSPKGEIQGQNLEDHQHVRESQKDIEEGAGQDGGDRLEKNGLSS